MKKTNHKKVESVAQYLLLIEGIRREHEINGEMKPIVFRGEPQCFKHVRASIFAGDTGEKNAVCVADEVSMISHAKKEYPHVFKECLTELDILTTMQHYRLPTRMIDVTTNPLVALYFACEKDFQRNGRIMYATGLEYKEEEILQIVATLAGVTVNEPFSVKELEFLIRNRCPFLDKISRRITKETVLFQIITQSFLFAPTSSNARIRAQHGAFIMSAFASPHGNLKNEYESLLHRGDNMWKEKEMNKIMFLKTHCYLDELFIPVYFTIPARKKDKILYELDKIGINKGTIYPDAEHQMISIADNQVRRRMYEKKNVEPMSEER
ncbi:MAG: FRG domain-containing protein [Bacteroidales bacterium]|nr:FRG domain-containing protein [Bacteroidales bacterium]